MARKLPIPSWRTRLTESYTYVDYNEYDPGRGGPTPTFDFTVDGDTLEVKVFDECYDAPDNPKTLNEALDLLNEHLNELEAEVGELLAFIKLANKATKLVTEDIEEDED